MSCKNRVSGTILARRNCYRDMATDVLICAAGLGLSSLIGSGLGALVRNIHHRWNDIFLGYCAGMMLAASLVCLIMPGVRMVPLADLWQPLLGVVAGVAFISLLDYFTPSSPQPLRSRRHRAPSFPHVGRQSAPLCARHRTPQVPRRSRHRHFGRGNRPRKLVRAYSRHSPAEHSGGHGGGHAPYTYRSQGHGASS